MTPIYSYIRDLARIPWRKRYARMRQNIPQLASYNGAWTKTYYVITVGRKKKKGYIHQAIESESDVISHNARAALQGEAIIILQQDHELLLMGINYIVMIKIIMNEV